MRDAINDYINFIYIEKKLSDNTKEAYLKDLTAFNEFINKKIDKIKTEDIRNYINHLYDLNVTDKTLARKIVSIRTFFNYLMKEKLIDVNPCEKIESPKLKKTLPNTLSEEDINKLLNFKPKLH